MISVFKQYTYRVLRWSEKYTKTDMVYLGKGGFWLSVGQAVNSLGSLLLAVGFAHFVSQDVYGNYKFILALAGIVTAFSLTGLGTAVTRAVARGHEGSLSKAVRTHFLWSFGMIIISFGIAGYYFINQNTTLSLSLLIVGAALPAITSLSHYEAFLAGKKEFRIKTLLSIIRNLTPIALLLGTIYVTDNVVAIILIYFLSQVLVVSLLYFFTTHRFPPNKKVEVDTVRYGTHLSAMNVLHAIAMHLDKILVFHFLGAAPLAVYAFALAVPKQIGSLNRTLSILVFPKMSTKPMEELKRLIPPKALLLFFLSAILALIYIFAAPYIYKILFPTYIEAVIYSQIYALTFLLFPAMLFEESLKANKQTRSLYIAKTVIPVFRISILILLTPLYGITGVIAALVTTRIFAFAVLLFFFARSK